MKYPSYEFKRGGKRYKVMFETVGMSFVAPVVYEMWLVFWVRQSDKWAFSATEMSDFVGMEERGRAKIADKTFLKWVEYLGDKA